MRSPGFESQILFRSAADTSFCRPDMQPSDVLEETHVCTTSLEPAYSVKSPFKPLPQSEVQALAAKQASHDTAVKHIVSESKCCKRMVRVTA